MTLKVKPEARISKEPRAPGELLTAMSAIRSHCLHCCCGQAVEVALCPITNCHVWPLRFGSGTRAKRIVAQEREANLTGTHWADQLVQPTGLEGCSDAQEGSVNAMCGVLAR